MRGLSYAVRSKKDRVFTMSTTFGSFEEFWAASKPFFERIKNDNEKLQRNPHVSGNDQQIAANAAQIAQLGEQMQATDARLDRLASMIATLAGTVAKQAEEIESHEHRLERLEGTA
jgi:chromosome segregation ATPase